MGRVGVALMFLLASHASAATCPIASFGADKKELCREDCLPMMLPEEIKRIRRGIYTEEVGGAIGEGMKGRWFGVNLDAGEFFTVDLVPDRERPAKAAKSITIRKAPKWGVFIVRKRSVPRPALEELVCAANRVWTAVGVQAYPLPHMTRAGYLRDGRAVKEFAWDESGGGAGALLKLLKEMDEVARRP